MSNDKMSPEMQIAIRRSPDYTAPSAELARELYMVKAGKGPGDALALVLQELIDLRMRCNKLEAQVKAQDAYIERIKAASNPAW